MASPAIRERKGFGPTAGVEEEGLLLLRNAIASLDAPSILLVQQILQQSYAADRHPARCQTKSCEHSRWLDANSSFLRSGRGEVLLNIMSGQVGLYR